ncbi:Nitroreductase family [Acididesulfobacillus acetoxydans]|uniref:Nitroreductase family n=1 Tax=Acididesulfobacillus acetoxydans TaxID=1561005 RepID=A0A8S0X4P0_9FIRM|nr:nitroreductase family protein [Acididesulfobacillus acetoxydans]CAA7600950.1 Nitroreductase family [Acididesulfobacillus acetoxydans]CEJ08894.1 Nitroreductase family [Acididesulfobacillus acetoxydans]
MLDAILKRHSVREFRRDSLSPEVLTELIEAMRLAPSANNIQPWKFIIVTGTNRAKVAGACVQEFVAEAPALVIALSEESRDDYNLAFAVSHLLLEAAARGFGTCVVRSFAEDQVKEVLDIPTNYHVFAVIPVGYARENMDSSHDRKGLASILSWETF